MSEVPLIVPHGAAPPAELLDEGDHGYHAHVCERAKMLTIIDQQLQGLERQKIGTEAVRDDWIGYLTQKYGLGPSDQVNEAFEIIRSPRVEG